MNAPSPVEALRSQHQSVAQPSSLLTLLQSKKVQDSLRRVSGKLLDPARLAKLALHSVKTTPKLAMCTPSSVLGAVMLSASFGLEPNTPSQQAFLIPYKRRKRIAGEWTDVYECQFQFGYRGMVTLAYRSGVVIRLKAEAIRENDEFDYLEGSEFYLKYRKNLQERGQLIGAFCFTKLRTEESAASVLPGRFIESIREKSQTYRALRDDITEARSDKARAKAEAAFADQPWVQWEDAMWAKTAIKHHTGQLPIFDIGQTILAAASAVDDASEAGVIDMDDFVDADAAIAAAHGEINPSSGEAEEPTTQQEAGPAQLPRDTSLPIDIGRERGERVAADLTLVPEPAQGQGQEQEQQDQQQAPSRPRQAAPRAERQTSTPSTPEEPAGFLFGPAE